MAIKTLKMLKKAGYDLIKVENTDLYATLRERIRFAGIEYRCRRCGHPLSRNQIFCDQCGLELMIDWKL
jgi:rRNA maturation endonuclease Nob1